VQVRAHAFTYPGSPEQTLTLAINGHAFGPVPLAKDWVTLEFATGSDVWRSGVNRLQLEFGSARAPAEVGMGGDPRPLAASVDYILVREP
jgi:hypothetical protein